MQLLKTKKQLYAYTAVFIVAELFFGHFIQKSTSLAYSLLTVFSVAVALLYVAISFENTYFHKLMLLALSATVVADFFLAGLVEIMGDVEQKTFAMCFFCVAQACYFLRIYQNHEKERTKKGHIFLRLSLSILGLGITMVVLKEKTNLLSLVAVLYFANLILNLIFAFTQIKISALLPIGLLFFLLCDTIIGLSVMSDLFIPITEGSLFYGLIHSGVNLAWVFYVPSQTLLAISVNEKKFRN